MFCSDDSSICNLALYKLGSLSGMVPVKLCHALYELEWWTPKERDVGKFVSNVSKNNKYCLQEQMNGALCLSQNLCVT